MQLMFTQFEHLTGPDCMRTVQRTMLEHSRHIMLPARPRHSITFAVMKWSKGTMPCMHSGCLSNAWRCPGKVLKMIQFTFIPQPDAKWFQSSMVHFYSFKQEHTCNHTGIKVRKMNHSLQATGASDLFGAELPEKMIPQQTGHQSIPGMTMYEQLTEEQQCAVSSILASFGSKSSIIQLSTAAQWPALIETVTCGHGCELSSAFNTSWCISPV